jgi:hypothetical protein
MIEIMVYMFVAPGCAALVFLLFEVVRFVMAARAALMTRTCVVARESEIKMVELAAKSGAIGLEEVRRRQLHMLSSGVEHRIEAA